MNEKRLTESKTTDSEESGQFDRFEKKWFNSNKAFCKYRKLDSGTIILENGSPLFFDVMKIPRTDCGKNIYDILTSKRAEYIHMLFDSLGNNNSTFKYVREASDGSSIWEVTATYSSNIMYCLAEPMISCSLLIKTAGSSDEDIYPESLDYTGTVITCKNSDGKLYIESCSRSLSEKAPSVREGADLGEILKKYMCRITTTRLVEECISKNQPMKYYDLTIIRTAFSTSEQPLGIVCISMIPVVSFENPKVVITVSNVRTDDFAASENSGKKIDSSAVFVLKRSDSGEVYIEKMNIKLALMLAEGEILYEDLCSSEEYSIYFEKHAHEVVVKKHVITGRNSAEYILNFIPGYAADQSRGVLGTVRPKPKVNRQEHLTGREREILSLAAAGNSNRYIALRLGISEGTVKKILHNGYTKLGIGSRVELVKIFSDKDI